MTKDEWLKYATDNQSKLASLIEDYHPANAKYSRDTDLPITAGMAEWACGQISKGIQEEQKGLPPAPVERFKLALAARDNAVIYSLLSDAWFGVPESTSCWQIEGFNEAVTLMDDPPDEEEVASAE
jgi:hypothetical protein